MTKTEMETRYQSAIKEIEKQKRASAAQSYAAGASILLYSDSKGFENCLLYTSPSPRDLSTSRMPSSA